MLCMFSLLWPRLALLCLRKQPLPIHIHWCVCLLPPHGPGCLLSEGRDSGCFGHCYLSSTPGTKWSLTDWLNTWMKLFYARGNQGLVRWCHLPPPPAAHSGAGVRSQSNSVVSAHNGSASCDLFSISRIMLFHWCYMYGIMQHISFIDWLFFTQHHFLTFIQVHFFLLLNSIPW